MEQELNKKIEEQGLKIDEILKSVEKMRKYFLITMWVTVIVIVVPIIGLMFVLPTFFNSYLSSFSGLGL
jgi:hypothetical protein